MDRDTSSPAAQNRQHTLPFALTCFVSALLLFLVKWAIPTENKELLYIVVGALIGAFGTIVNYEWGSSRSSSDKNDLLKNMPPTPPTP